MEPLLQEFKVDFFFGGHVHVYERSHGLMDYNITDLPDADGNYRNLQNPLHITVGTGVSRGGATRTAREGCLPADADGCRDRRAALPRRVL